MALAISEVGVIITFVTETTGKPVVVSEMGAGPILGLKPLPRLGVSGGWMAACLFQRQRSMSQGLRMTQTLQIVSIPLGRSGMCAIVDSSDYPKLSAYTWVAIRGRRTWYAYTVSESEGRRRFRAMHREILGLPGKSPIVDHADGNGLNNTRGNLRVCSIAQNNWNSDGGDKTGPSGCRGVYFDPRGGKWRAQIRTDGRRISLGSFSTIEAAADAYASAAKEQRGEFTNAR